MQARWRTNQIEDNFKFLTFQITPARLRVSLGLGLVYEAAECVKNACISFVVHNEEMQTVHTYTECRFTQCALLT